jgi:murein DD-endopeptidase MepM/ murein hydrolase activator NlpD
MAIRPRVRVLIIAAAIFAALAALIWTLSVRFRATPVTPIALPAAEEPGAAPTAPQNTAPPPLATPTVSPTAEATPEVRGVEPENKPSVTSSPAAAPPVSTTLLVPVAGVRPEQLHDTYNEARSEGRTHNAIDIPAPRGTPVLAAADGRIVKLFNSVPGGITIYQLSTDNKMIYYYAHLERYADGLKEDQFARRGEVIGYVGDTGNAGPGNYHLHFSVSIVSDPKRYWEGVNINPYPLLVK